mgnify:CR=1 FL=1
MGKSLRGKRLKRLGLFWMGVFLSFSLWAQTGVICGTVTDAKMKEPLIGASVVIEGTTVGAITDIDGNFRIENVKPGTYTVAALRVVPNANGKGCSGSRTPRGGVEYRAFRR